MDRVSRIDLPYSDEAPAIARRHVAGVARDWPSDTVDAALLLTSELVANAVQHGDKDVVLVVDQCSAYLRIDVRDESEKGPRPRTAAPGEDLAEGGRGLHIIDAVASRWGSEHLPDGLGKTVWFELDRPY